MSQTPNHECQICGKMYYACDNCTKTGKPRSVSCSPNCYAIYLAITESRLNVVDKETSVDYFNRLGINTNTIDKYIGLTDIVRNQIKNMITIEDEIENEIEEIPVKAETTFKKKSKQN